MPTLYRKYRPQSFSSVMDQEHVVRTIENEIANGKIAHAYLFSGPRGVGKTTIARLLAKSVNCAKRKAGEFEPCNSCGSCEEISAGRNIDVIEIDAASHTGVDNVRENIIENAQFKPTKSKYKVFIIDEVHMLSTSAFNALLKTLEEPPAHVIFVMATTELHKIPATIVSRCQRFNFKKISFEEMKKRLKGILKEEKIDVEESVVERIVNKSDGALRDAESLLGQLLSLNQKKITSKDAEIILPSSDIETTLRFLEQMIEGDTKEALATIRNLDEEGVNVEQFLYDLIEILRDLMIMQAGLESSAAVNYNKEHLKRLRALAKSISPIYITALIELAIEKRRQAKTLPIPVLALELMVVEQVNKPESNRISNNGSSGNSKAANESTPPVTSTPPDPKPSRPLTATIKETISHLTHRREIKTTLDELKTKWPEVIKKVTEKNPSLSFILKMGDVVFLNEHGLRLSVPYSFHKDKIEEQKSKKSIEDCLQEICGEKIPLSAELGGGPVPVKPADEELNNLAAEFGGEVVE